jgi:hypothetical protein
MGFLASIIMKDVHIFCDMDGVLCNWEEHFFQYIGKRYTEFERPENFKVSASLPISWWTDMPWMDDGIELLEHIKDFDNLYILSSPCQDKTNKSIIGKTLWLQQMGFLHFIPEDRIILRNDKHKEVREEGLSILIDDTQKKIDAWRQAGGVGILHKNTKDSIRELTKVLDEYNKK